MRIWFLSTILMIGCATTRVVRTTWLPACGEDGPKGLALDHKLDFLLIACTDKVEVLDAGRDGKASIGTGASVDNID